MNQPVEREPYDPHKRRYGPDQEHAELMAAAYHTLALKDWLSGFADKGQILDMLRDAALKEHHPDRMDEMTYTVFQNRLVDNAWIFDTPRPRKSVWRLWR